MKAGWSLGWVSAIDCEGRTIWIVDAHRDGKRFVVGADKKLTAFVELERATTANDRYIEISATNSELGQLLVRVTSPKNVEAQRWLSGFHDKLLAAMGRFNTQITAYTGTASLPPNELDIDLSKRLVYLIVEP
jgi:hypothetical protein